MANEKDINGNAIEIRQLTKVFGNVRALDKLDLSVRTGHIHGFLGPNGAGKSTTIRVLLGLLHKTGGEVRMLGSDPWMQAVSLHRRLAYVPGEVNLWPNLSGGECIDLFGTLRGGLDPKRLKILLERFELDPTKKSHTYSKGNRQKVALVAAFASDVELFILDEPTSGLDPLMEAQFQECVREAKNAGKTVLLSSHILAEVEALCDHLTIIREGRAVRSGTLDQLRHLTRTSVRAETVTPATGLETMQGVHKVTRKETVVQFEVEADSLEGVLKHLLQFGVRKLESAPPSLEELFMRHYTGETEPAAGES